MQSFPIYTIESAPEQSKAALQNLKAAFGMVPNIAGAMATSPVLINSLVGLFQRVHGGSFTEAQIQILLLTNAVTNACSWAVAFHTALALKEGLDPDLRRSFAALPAVQEVEAWVSSHPVALELAPHCGTPGKSVASDGV